MSSEKMLTPTERHLENFRKRTGLGTNNTREKLVLQSEKTFEKQLRDSPSSMRVRASIPGEIDIFNHANYVDGILLNISDNDIKAADQKYFLVRKNENFDIGCYVEFDNTYWIAIFKEHRTLDTHKKFTLIKCNNIWKYKKNGIIYEFPIYVQNLSLYSDGLADNKYTSQEDGKVTVYYGENPITKNIAINTRVLIGHRIVFRMTNINDYEFRSTLDGHCVIKAMLLQTTLLEEDDLENNIAWNEDSESKEIDITLPKIVGDNVVMLGSKKKYDCANDAESRSWELECSNELKKYIEFEPFGFGNKWVNIKFPSRMEFVGETVTLKLFVSNKLVDTMDITIKGL